MNGTTQQSVAERVQEREQSLRMTIARFLDAVERYPDDMPEALAQARAQLRREPLWCALDAELSV